jgi:hypothetical protein
MWSMKLLIMLHITEVTYKSNCSDISATFNLLPQQEAKMYIIYNN